MAEAWAMSAEMEMAVYERVVFLHTGGSAARFGYTRAFSFHTDAKPAGLA
jgi:1-aminocyclopropane-1-carboxylate deaminase/D-cysteine desulfhydrase-like pyridoxal-dependent ACC family enzyme